jgi:7-cyano-7-deazaguanine synthase
MAKHVVVSLSGGMDSSTLLLRCLKEYDTVTALSFDYGQKHRVELERAQSLVEYVNNILVVQPQALKDFLQEKNGDDEFGDRERIFNEVMTTPINYRQIELNGLSQLLNSALVAGGAEVPEGHYAEENMKATVVPNRNKIFASITQAVALSIADKTGEQCDIAMGIHAGDHAIYPDCRQEFRDADDHAFRVGNWGSEKVGYFTPYLEGDKFTILQDGEVLCNELQLDFNEVYSRTNTSYKPILLQVDHNTPGRVVMNVGMWNQGYYKWYSDYKSASSVERVEAFIKLGRPDSVEYADETGPVTWEHVVAEVTKVLKAHE